MRINWIGLSLVGSAGRSVSKPTLTGKRCEAADFVGDLGQPAVAADIPPGSRLWNLSDFSGIFFGGMIRKNLYNLGFSERLRGNWSSRMPRGNLTRGGFSMLRPADPTRVREWASMSTLGWKRAFPSGRVHVGERHSMHSFQCPFATDQGGGPGRSRL